jgi:uncharacterized protein YbjT (DUF2867 family)
MKLALTGATGFIGSHALTELQQHGHAVTALVRDEAQARARLCDYFTEVQLLDRGTDAAKARAVLGWHPSHPTLGVEFRHGSYWK